MCVCHLFLAWESWAGGTQKASVRREVSKWEELIIRKTKDTHISCEPGEGSQACIAFQADFLRSFLLGKEPPVTGEDGCALRVKI